MKYVSFLPVTALIALSLMSLLVQLDVIPPGQQILSSIQGGKNNDFYAIIFLIILLESIVYVGFYFPGQFFAVILVVGANPKPIDVLYLTIAMVLAATIGSIINYGLGRCSSKHQKTATANVKIKHLLLAMVHINSLAFFMFAQGSQQKPIKIVGLAGILNMPYYLLLIAGTAVLSEQVMQMAENTVFLFSAIGVWLVIAIFIDIKSQKHRSSSESH